MHTKKPIVLIQNVNCIKPMNINNSTIKFPFFQGVTLLASYITLSPEIMEHTYNCWKYF